MRPTNQQSDNMVWITRILAVYPVQFEANTLERKRIEKNMTYAFRMHKMCFSFKLYTSFALLFIPSFIRILMLILILWEWVNLSRVRFFTWKILFVILKFKIFHLKFSPFSFQTNRNWKENTINLNFTDGSVKRSLVFERDVNNRYEYFKERIFFFFSVLNGNLWVIYFLWFEGFISFSLQLLIRFCGGNDFWSGMGQGWDVFLSVE